MNLGSAELKAVNGECDRDHLGRMANVPQVSKPQLAYTQSKRSASASEEFFSDYASDASSNRSSPTQYETPPSRASTPVKHLNPVDSEMTLPARSPVAAPPPLQIKPFKIDRKPTPQDVMRGDISPGVDDSPYIRFAIEQLTRDEELLGRGRQGSVTSTDYPINRIVGDEGLGYYGDPAPATQPPKQPKRLPPSSGRDEKRRSQREDVLLPVDHPNGTQWPELGFVPIILRPVSLVLLILTCLLMVAGLLFSNVYSLKNHGLYDYDGNTSARYFIFQYLPQLPGVIIILWLFTLQAAIYRVTPFFIMASRRPLDRVLQDVPILPAHFLFPHLVHFRVGEPLVGTILFIFWISNFTVPLLSCLYQTGIFNDVWRWTSVEGVGYTLVVLYLFLIVALLLCLFRFRARGSALMWDPVSIADLIPLFQRSNLLHIFEQSEITVATRRHVQPRLARLGYWTPSEGTDVFHGVAEVNAPVRSSAPIHGLTEKPRQPTRQDTIDIERQRYSDAESFTQHIHSPYIRYRWAPWFLRDSAVLSWVTFAAAISITFIVISFVHSAVEHGFVPLLPSGTNSAGFSSSNFLYSFIPALLGMFLFLAWQPIDMYFRAVQTFVNLSHPNGATAERSLLLAYPSCHPFETTFLALINRDLKVAWISFVAIMSATIPVLAGGVFTALYFRSDGQIRIVASMPGYYALVVFVAIYAASFLVVWPTRKRYLPHKIHTLADLLSFIYQSPLLTDPAFKEPRTKADLVGRLIRHVWTENASGRTERNAKYAFGIYMGRDGREHLGIDRLQRPGSGEMLITTGMRR